MKNVFFAGKFLLQGGDPCPLEQRLAGDYRSLLLGDPAKIVRATDTLWVNPDVHYGGTFYCEQASDGQYSSTDCMVVNQAEFDAVCRCDCVVAVLDQSFSCGTVVEIEWALQHGVPIIIFYRTDALRPYRYKSEYWFVIADAVRRDARTKVFTFTHLSEVVERLSNADDAFFS